MLHYVQVELGENESALDVADSVFIHRSVVEELNAVIVQHGTEKVL